MTDLVSLIFVAVIPIDCKKLHALFPYTFNCFCISDSWEMLIAIV